MRLSRCRPPSRGRALAIASVVVVGAWTSVGAFAGRRARLWPACRPSAVRSSRGAPPPRRRPGVVAAVSTDAASGPTADAFTVDADWRRIARPMASGAVRRDGPIRVAIYGGAFDPPTVDHMRLAAQILRSDEVDEVWLTPCGPRPDKKMATPTHDRWAMCHVAVNSFFPPELAVKVCEVDVHRSQAMFTYDLLRKLSADFRGTHSFAFVIGTDWLQPGADLRQWESEEGVTGDKLVKEFDFIVLRRPGYDVVGDLDQFGPRFKWLDIDGGYELIEGNGSSTAVRARLRTTRDVYSVAGLVPSGVLGYIRRQNLYTTSGDQRNGSAAAPPPPEATKNGKAPPTEADLAAGRDDRTYPPE